MAATNHSDVQRVISKCRDSGCLLLVFVYGKCLILEYVQLNTHTLITQYLHTTDDGSYDELNTVWNSEEVTQCINGPTVIYQ